MRIEKRENGLYQAEIAQSLVASTSGVLNGQINLVSNNLISSSGVLDNRITLVNNDLISASSALDTKIDQNLNKIKIRGLYSTNYTPFSTNVTTPPVFITGTNTTYTKNYSDTELRVLVFFTANSASTLVNTEFADISYSINSGSSWLGTSRLKGYNYHPPAEMLPFVIHYNLGVLPAGSVDFRLGLNKLNAVSAAYFYSFAYQFMEVLPSA